jgi:hypothetical protein
MLPAAADHRWSSLLGTGGSEAVRAPRRAQPAAIAALVQVLDGSACVTNPGWMTRAYLLEAIARDALGDPAAAEAPWSVRLISPGPTARSSHSFLTPRRS